MILSVNSFRKKFVRYQANFMRGNGLKEYLHLTFTSLVKGQASRKTFFLIVLQIMVFLAGGLVFLTICAVCMLLNGTVRTPPEPLEYEIVEFSPCSGWSNSRLVEKKQTFRSDEEHIFACGHIETNYPIL